MGDERGERWRVMDALVDTGASIMSAPSSALRDLGVRPVEGEVREMPIGQTWIRFAGKELITQMLFNEEGTSTLLGALALEGTFLGVDPVEQKRVPVTGHV